MAGCASNNGVYLLRIQCAKALIHDDDDHSFLGSIRTMENHVTEVVLVVFNLFHSWKWFFGEYC